MITCTNCNFVFILFFTKRDTLEQVKSQCDKYKEQTHQLEFKLKELEAALVRRDTVITDLRQEKYEVSQNDRGVSLFL